MAANEKWLFFALGFFVIAVRGLLYWQTGFVADDALITYRYAENFLAGNGLVYNLGEKVLGTTTPFQTFLIILGGVLGIPAKVFSPCLNILCDVFTAFLIVLLFKNHFKRIYFGFFTAFIFAVFPTPWIWSISGMEVALYAFTILGSIYFYLSRRFALSLFLLALAFLTRIDALVLFVAIALISLVCRQKIGWKPVLVLVLTLAPWLIFSTLYYGSPVPNSVIAKKVFYGELPEFRSAPLDIIQGFIFGGKTHLVSNFYSIAYSIPFLFLFACALIGSVALLGYGVKYFLLPLWLGGYVAFFIVGQTHMHPWYFSAFYAVYIPVVGVGLMKIWDGATALLKCGPSLKRGLAVGILLMALGVAYFEGRTIAHYLSEYQKTENFLTEIAYWVKEKTNTGDKVYYSDIGKLGYYSDRYILDSVGIVSPIVTKHYKNRDWVGPIKEVQPELVLLAETDFRLPSFAALNESEKLYKEIKRFDFKKSKFYTRAVYSESASGVEFPVIIAYEKK